MLRSTWPILFLACTTDPPPKQALPVEMDIATEEPELNEDDDEVYAYSAVGKADPFKSFIHKPAPDPTTIKPLQRWELDQLHLVAVVLDGPNPYAMVEDPKGRGHVIRRGDLIGKNWGRVASIQTRTVKIREEHLDALGKKNIYFQTIDLPKLPRPEEIEDEFFEVVVSDG